MTMTPEQFMTMPPEPDEEPTGPFWVQVPEIADVPAPRIPWIEGVHVPGCNDQCTGGSHYFEGTDPLTSIATSLEKIAGSFERASADNDELMECRQRVADLEAEVAEIEALHDAKQELIERTLAVCKPSVSKLAIAVREVLEPVVVPPAAEPHPSGPQCTNCQRYFADQELLDLHACAALPAPIPVENAVEMGHAVPAHDAGVEEWRAYARSLGYSSPKVDNANRSQIRSLLGIAHGGETS